MNKRTFLTTVAVTGLLPATASQAAAAAASGPALLTLSGAVGKTNRGALDTALDQMMIKHGIKFDKAFAFDAAALRRLPTVSIKPTLEYDAKAHELSGPLLTIVLEAAGVAGASPIEVNLRALDGYNVALPLADVRRYGMIVATHLDGAPLGLGGLGPQWAVYDADRIAPFKDQPLKQRFALCPWGIYHIGLKPV